MARLVIRTATGPQKVGDKDVCMCGLTSNLPFCDGSHKKTVDEDKETTYFYEGNDRKPVAELVCDEEEGGCCGGCGDGDKEATGCCGGSCGCSHDEK